MPFKPVRELVYALTFLTGINSIERSAHEGSSHAYIRFRLPILSNTDTLLILFNAAISNLVYLASVPEVRAHEC